MGAVGGLGVALLALFLLSNNVEAQKKYTVCASIENRNDCAALERGNSNVTCVVVEGSIDCMILMAEGKVDFASFTPEETVLAAKMKQEEFSIIGGVRHIDKSQDKFAFQSVVVVSKNHTKGLEGLYGSKLCHPGLGRVKEQMWSNRVLKYFERKVTNSRKECPAGSKTSGEDEAFALSKFFLDACRPGLWLPDIAEDKKLKEKYPSLCTLCTTNRDPNCDSYRYFEPKGATGVGVSSHLSAMSCLQEGFGTVAYVGYQNAMEYFQKNSASIESYSLLCENGSTISLGGKDIGTEAPCAWISQPWGGLLTRKDISVQLLADLKKWMPSGRSGEKSESWVGALSNILLDQSYSIEYESSPASPVTYVTKGRPIPDAESDPCHKALKWCTVSRLENNKCLWVRAASTTLGLEPEIECVEGKSPLDCLQKIKVNEADFISVDSNLGLMGRKYYNLTSAIYQEINRANASKVFALIKEEHSGEINRFEKLKDKNACFPEYSGIAWLAFIVTGHERGIISRKDCDYADQVVKFFKASCAPGAADTAHFPSKAADPLKLCSACKGFSPRGNELGIIGSIESPEKECPADSTNEYYGNRGALKCLSQQESHVAFLEGQNLKAHASDLKLKPEDFRILCRNGSLALKPGFDVDDDCALSVTIDSEVLRRRGFKDSTNLQLSLQDMDNWYGYNSGSKPIIDLRIFSEFNATKNLLFKEVTIGFATKDSQNQLVENYVKLFQHTETCTGGGAAYTASISVITILAALFVHLFV